MAGVTHKWWQIFWIDGFVVNHHPTTLSSSMIHQTIPYIASNMVHMYTT